MSKDTAERPTRDDRLDAVRGASIVWMMAFHAAFDLHYFHFIRQDFYNDPFWTVQRIVIVSIFLFCAGMGQSVAIACGQGWPRFWRRWGQIAVCAVLVTAGSLMMFPPDRVISFGVLHGMALMLILVRLTAHLGLWLWPMGAVCIVLPLYVQHPFFDSIATNWVGLVTRKPSTEDFLPLLPWLGIVWWGAATGQRLQAWPWAWLTGPLPNGLAPLALLGRWPLSIYMLHQPVLIACIAAAAWLLR